MRDPNKTFFKRYIPVQYLRYGLIIFILIMAAYFAGIKLMRWIEGLPPVVVPSAAPLTDWSRTKRHSYPFMNPLMD
ncbi:hypothetical protein PRIPAC_94690 [Pristionchus pacificus]|uniref:Uncharacterized protein n=1 Tax=Pristionchus pacificus TaxID=54126 RepID=A0A454Y4X9_PRIPA|nr:hypothetical protein PRIPAC_94690 [Pristionchus pacificus]|eukprot:PDM62695.1 hypothetical protein PRIPAC_49910 [Pristionchus pacificus]